MRLARPGASSIEPRVDPGDREARGGDAGAHPAMPDRPDVFVSYSRKDRAFAVDWLVPALQGGGRDVWIDDQDIPPAADWRQTVLDGIAKSSAFVFVLSPDSLRSAVCAEELERACHLGKRLVPVLRRDGGDVPEALQRPNWILLRDSDDSEAGMARLADALDTDLRWRQTHTRLTVRAEEWARESQDHSFLLRGSDLKAAEQWLGEQAGHKESPTAAQAEYVLRSRAAANRRQRFVLASVIIALVVAVGLAIFALAQRNQAIEQARVATSRELAATSLALTGRDPELSVVLAQEASRKKPTAQAEDALRQSLQRWPERRAIDAGAPIETTDYSPDGGLFVTAGGRAAQLYDSSTGRLIRRLPVASGRVESARFSPDGRQVLIAAEGGVTVVDPASGRLAARLSSNGAPVSNARFAADGHTAIATTVDGARVFDPRTGKVAAELDDPAPVMDSHLSPDGRLAVTHGPFTVARVWRVATGRATAALRHDQPITGVAVSPDGRLLAVSATDLSATVWDMRRGRRIATLRHANTVTGASFSADGRLMFTNSSFAKVWDTRARRQVREIRQDTRVLTSAFSRDAKLAVTGDESGDARVYDVATGRLLHRLTGHGGPISTVGFSPDGRLVLTGSRDGTARIWESTPGSSALDLRVGDERVTQAVLSPDGRTAATAGDRGTRLWDAVTGKPTARLGQDTRTTALAWSADGRKLGVGGQAGSARIWDTSARRPLASLRGHTRRILDIALSPDGRYVATTGDDATLKLWDARSGRVLGSVGPVPAGVNSVAFGLGGRRLVAEIGGGTVVLATDSGRDVSAARDELGIGVSPDGRTFAAGRPGAVAIRRAVDGKEVARLAANDGAFDSEFSRDGRILAAVDPHGAAHAWDVESRRQLLTLRRPDVFALTIAPDDRLAAAGHLDGFVRVFQLGSGDRVATLGTGRDGTVRSVAFVGGGRSVLATHASGSARVYPCDVCRSQTQLLQLARERAPRHLTAAERRRYLHGGS